MDITNRVSFGDGCLDHVLTFHHHVWLLKVSSGELHCISQLRRVYKRDRSGLWYSRRGNHLSRIYYDQLTKYLNRLCVEAYESFTCYTCLENVDRTEPSPGYPDNTPLNWRARNESKDELLSSKILLPSIGLWKYGTDQGTGFYCSQPSGHVYYWNLPESWCYIDRTKGSYVEIGKDSAIFDKLESVLETAIEGNSKRNLSSAGSDSLRRISDIVDNLASAQEHSIDLPDEYSEQKITPEGNIETDIQVNSSCCKAVETNAEVVSARNSCGFVVCHRTPAASVLPSTQNGGISAGESTVSGYHGITSYTTKSELFYKSVFEDFVLKLTLNDPEVHTNVDFSTTDLRKVVRITVDGTDSQGHLFNITCFAEMQSDYPSTTSASSYQKYKRVDVSFPLFPVLTVPEFVKSLVLSEADSGTSVDWKSTNIGRFSVSLLTCLSCMTGRTLIQIMVNGIGTKGEKKESVVSMTIQFPDAAMTLISCTYFGSKSSSDSYDVESFNKQELISHRASIVSKVNESCCSLRRPSVMIILKS